MAIGMYIALLAGLLVVPHVTGHGFIETFEVCGTTYPGFSAVSAQPPGPRAEWPHPGGMDGSAVGVGQFSNTGYFRTSDINCGKGSVPASEYVTVAAGSQIKFHWNPWPADHKGFIVDYMANCHGSCLDINPDDLEWFKVKELGLVDSNGAPKGKWASDQLIENGSVWETRVPCDLEPGNYVFRSEIGAVHLATNPGGPQLYPNCFNFRVTGNGKANPTGTPGQQLYHDNDPGVHVDINQPQPLTSYIVPGPPVYSGSGTCNGGGCAGSAGTLNTIPDTSSSASSNQPCDPSTSQCRKSPKHSTRLRHARWQ